MFYKTLMIMHLQIHCIYLQIFIFEVKWQFLYFSSLLSLIYSIKNLFLKNNIKILYLKY